MYGEARGWPGLAWTLVVNLYVTGYGGVIHPPLPSNTSRMSSFYEQTPPLSSVLDALTARSGRLLACPEHPPPPSAPRSFPPVSPPPLCPSSQLVGGRLEGPSQWEL